MIQRLKCKKKEGIVLLILIIFGSICWYKLGTCKVISFCDEAYTYESANSVWKEYGLQQFQQWISGHDVSDYFAATDHFFNHNGIVGKLWYDHLPMYFFIFRLVSLYLFHGSSSAWIGMTVNLMIWILLLGTVFYIGRKLLKNVWLSGLLVILFCLVNPMMLQQLILIRMYLMLTWISIVTWYLAVRISEDSKISLKKIIIFYTCMVVGFMTHYYYWFFMAFLALVCGIYLLVHRKWIRLLVCAGSVILAFGTMWLAFPRWTGNMQLGNADAAIKKVWNFATLKAEVLAGLQGMVQSMPGIRMPWLQTVTMVTVILVIGFIFLYRKNRSLLLFGVTGAVTALLQAMMVSHTTQTGMGRYYWLASSVIMMILIMILLDVCGWLLKKLTGEKVRLQKAVSIGAVLIILLWAGVQSAKNQVMFSDPDNNAKKKVLESYASVPWILYSNYFDWQYYQVVFDFRIPDQICRVNVGMKGKKDPVLQPAKEVLVYTLGQSITDAEKYVSECTGYPYKIEKLMDREQTEVYLLKRISDM